MAPRERSDPETALRCVAGCCGDKAQTCHCHSLPQHMNLICGHLAEEPGRPCAERTEPTCSLPHDQEAQGIFSPFSGDTSQCPCLLLSPCCISSLQVSSSIVPGGGAALTCRLSRRSVPRGQELLPCFPLALLSEQPVLEAEKPQPTAWRSPEQGQGEQEEGSGS